MHPANGEKIEPPEKATFLPTTPPRDPEKQSLKVEEVKPANMPRSQRFFLTLLVLAILGLTIVSASSNQGLRNGAVAKAVARERLRFQELLNSVEPSSLHEVLHQHLKEKYRDGVYQEDRQAMEVVHQENAEVAQSLVELAKRQSGSGNGTTTTAVVTTTAATIAETTTTVLDTQTDTGSTTATSENSQPPPTTQISSQPPPTTLGGTTSTQVQPTSSSPASVESTQSTPTSTINVKSSSSSEKGSTSATSSQSITKQILYTSTLANGAITTVTSITVVPADIAQTDGGNGGTSTNTGTASLQTNSAQSNKNLGINGVLGALGLIFVAGGL